MKNKRNEAQKGDLSGGIPQKIVRLFKWIAGSLSRNLGLKLLSLLIAILMWNYVITTDKSITRAKTIYNLTGTIRGQTVLTDNKLALTEYPLDELSGINVTLDVPQADYSKVSAGNVQVTLDLSNVRTAGTQEVPLSATTSYGRVHSITPQTLTLDFETLDSRNVGINVALNGQSDDYWYNVTRTNPTSITVSGAASVVQRLASAKVNVNVRSMDRSTITAMPYVLLDVNGELIPQNMLNSSTSSVSVSLDIYPTSDIPISTDYANVVTGVPAEGYVLQSVSVQPESIVVAAEPELLEGLTELMVEPVSIDGASQSFTARTTVTQLSDFKNVSSEQVYINVTIAEETISGFVENVKVLFKGKAENLVATYEPLTVYVTGPRSAVTALQETGLTVNVDLTGLEAGYNLLDPVIDEEMYPGVTLQSEAVSVTLTDVSLQDDSEDE